MSRHLRVKAFPVAGVPRRQAGLRARQRPRVDVTLAPVPRRAATVAPPVPRPA